jgi:ribonuclease E
MPAKMLIDATHPEETRVVVVRDGKVEEFDFEAAARKQLRGNIYLAKVTRVEPSLQAAFVDYGGNRHGFLAFSEIHPDYYQIPYADRRALIEEDEAEDAEESAAEAAEDQSSAETDSSAVEIAEDGSADDGSGAVEGGGSVVEVAAAGYETVESIGGDDALEELPVRKARPRRSYKIQEVIKKRQILLVQVVKEERGNKGAALTTYLSLAGRYSVLMPNTARGGGISRKITNAADRKRLKEVAGDLDVPEGMGVILRTAGASRTKAEIKRDFEYLLRLWENVRELTLKSIAPTLVYEEGSLVKRAIRDLYTKDIDQVLVAGDNAYREAKDFMRMLMPSHAKNVQPYRETEPIFARHGIENQLDAMFSPVVTLKSGGYIVLNQTEALVSIDVNSGRSTREHNIEDTALKTNLEAADEVARQLRLRDLAGLIVIDFIDMEEKRNNRAVERRLKEALRHDRARIQVGRISHFGLLEMSRQRIRAGILEGSMQPCPHCAGTGRIRSVESVALHLLRSIENELLKGRPTDITVRTRSDVALYVLNQKRGHLADLEARFSVVITINADDGLGGVVFKLEKGEPARPRPHPDAVVRPVSVEPDDAEADVEAEEDAEENRAERQAAREREEVREDGAGRRRRRRRRRRGGTGEGAEADARKSVAEGSTETADTDSPPGEESDGGDGEERASGEEGGQRRRRRGRRGGRRHRRDSEAPAPAGQDVGTAEAFVVQDSAIVESSGPTDAFGAMATTEPMEPVSDDAMMTGAADAAPAAAADPAVEETEAADDAPKKPRRRRKKVVQEPAEAGPDSVTETPAAEPLGESAEVPASVGEATEAAEPVASEEGQPAPAAADAEKQEPAVPAGTVAVEPTADAATRQAGEAAERRKGWWQRRRLFGQS